VIRVKLLEEKFYGDRTSVGAQFRQMVHSYLSPEHRVLNAGCGSVGWLRLRGKCQEVVGVDMDNGVLLNPDVDVPVVGNIEGPLQLGSFDLIVCAYVVEHLCDPIACFRNLSMALRKGGILLILTPNLAHYAILVSKLTPQAFHKWFLKRMGRQPENIFATYYRANTRARLANMLVPSGFRPRELRMVEDKPDYLAFSAPSFFLGICYERIVSLLPALGCLRSTIMAAFERVE